MCGMENKISRYIQAGYTHLIQYRQYSKTLQMYCPCEFPTTKDAVEKHVEALKNRPGLVQDVRVSPL